MSVRLALRQSVKPLAFGRRRSDVSPSLTEEDVPGIRYAVQVVPASSYGGYFDQWDTSSLFRRYADALAHAHSLRERGLRARVRTEWHRGTL